MSIVTREKLLEAGVQFGHQTKRWNPKMRKYIFGQRNGIHIIDLQKSIRKLDEAYNYVKELSANGGKILFVGTKKQAKQAIEDGALKTNSPYVTERWLGGNLTNFKTIKSSIKKLIDLENKAKSGELKLLTKKEQMLLEKERNRLDKNLGGIRNMYKLPDAVFVSDIITNKIAVEEAVKLNIPVIAICDSNSDPEKINYIIPGNDDATKSITLITNIIVQAILDGRKPHSGTTKITKENSEDETNAPKTEKTDQAVIVKLAEAAKAEVADAKL
ncbi:30S ribosomal protein S2 [Spiroplasma attinicola]|uniref:30S ribosomal protein S2 n=1 Tax=Spiroplasma attinicola TaxID=2904537 RepID=UPI0020229CCF|nr:30S ribosomal protein S2 [Spiroplasma sp. JKS002670]MCL8209664.1 30S ribosomal protein S2 [Spiroplasma sp. JKS002670]